MCVRKALFCVLVLGLVSNSVGTGAAADSLDVGNRKQLFIDHKFIDSKRDIDLVVNPPEKLPEAVLKCEHPWEAFRITYHSVAEDQGTYKMWYEAFDGDQWGGSAARMLYATSTDGRNWVKPNLGLVEYKGSTDNNILLDAYKLEYIFLDTNPDAPASERYKMLSGVGVTRMRTSADGIHWSAPGPVVWDYHWDTQKQAWWDQDLGKYVIQTRGLIKNDTNNPEDLPFPFVDPIPNNPAVVDPNLYRAMRQLVRVEADDIMQPWPVASARTVMCGDELDPLRTDIYHPGGVYKYPYADDAYFMFPWPFDQNARVLKVQFAASRNGWNWMRYDRQVYIPLGAVGEYDDGSLLTLGPFFRDGDYLYQFYSTTPWTHDEFRNLSQEEQNNPANWGRAEYHLAKYRLDGFVSADASAEGGTLETPTLMFDGQRLFLNIEVLQGGSARVAIVDGDGSPLPGFTLDDCDVIQANDVAYEVRWNGDSNISGLAGTPVGLLFEMSSTKLYAFQFMPEPCHATVKNVSWLESGGDSSPPHRID